MKAAALHIAVVRRTVAVELAVGAVVGIAADIVALLQAEELEPSFEAASQGQPVVA